MPDFVTVRLRCPVCDTEFAADELHGARRMACETDFRPVFEGADPLLTHMHSCPECRYSAYREGFETEPSDEDELVVVIDDDERSLPRPFVAPPDEEDALALRRWSASGELTAGLVPPGGDPFGAMRFLLAARVHEFLHDDAPLVAAHYLLRAAWCARASNDRDAERTALRELLLRLSHLLEHDEVAEGEKLRLHYLAGEAARRSGDFGRALEFFALAEAAADPDEEEGALFGSLARRQRQLAALQSDVIRPFDECRPVPDDADDDDEAPWSAADDGDEGDGNPTLN